MDHNNNKTWLWRKKSTEKMIVVSDKVNLSPTTNYEEIQTLLTAKVELEKDLKSSNDKLSLCLSECNTKDGIVKKHVKMAEEAMEGWENAEAKAATLKQELDAVIEQKAAGEERVTHLEVALKESMQQLHFVRDEQERRVHDAVMKAATEFERSQKKLEGMIAETSKRTSKLVAENTQLSKALLAKEKSIEDLIRQKAQEETDLNALMSRLESTEKENASLKYEVRVLEKELEIRNEEREFNRRTADASHKQHLEGVKKIAKLESECQKLRLLVRKRLPGPAALAKMRSEVDVLGSVEMRRRRTKSSTNGFTADSTVDNSLETFNKQVSFLTEQLCAMEEDNNSLKEALDKKANELQVSRSMYARTASKLSQVESHLDELSKGQTSIEPSRRGRSGIAPYELSHASMSDVGSDDKISCAESWASALISELEHFKHGKQRGSPSSKTVGASDISLMDDFAEMEKLAIVSVDKQSGSPHVSCDEENATVNPLETGLNGYVSEVTGKEIIPVPEFSSGVSNQEIKSEKSLIRKNPDWLNNILEVVLEQTRTTQRKPYEILEDVAGALADTSQGHLADSFDSKESVKPLDASNSLCAGGYNARKPTDKYSLIDPSCGINDDDASLTDRNTRHMQSDLGKSILKIIELVEGITLPCYGALETSPRMDGHLFPYKNTETSSEYAVRVFQWKTSELGAVLQKFVHNCYDMLNGKSDVDRFAQELTSALDWIMNHCFSLQDVSSMRDAIKKHLDLDEAPSESELEVGLVSQLEVNKKCLNHGHLSCLSVVSDATELQKSFEKDELQCVIIDENNKLKDELTNLKSAKNDLEGRLQSALDRTESLMSQLQESKQIIAHLRAEVHTPKTSKAATENQMLVKQDLDAQCMVSKAELNEAQQKSSCLEMELENKSSHCEELEATCLELQLQLESVTKKTISNQEEEKQLRSDWEITAASEKLAECQETILNLGKQLKALASPCNTALLDKVMSTSTEATDASVAVAAATISTTPAAPKTLMNQRSSLLDQMLAEDNVKKRDSDSKSRKIEGSEYDNSALVRKGVIEPLEKILFLNGSKRQDDNVATSSLAIVPSKKQGGGNLWRKLLWRKKKSSIKRPLLLFPS
ncbi:filament-like plant protein 7 [Euphorbia lathyris]|uniref:filament-like plant protein 7 n=1 Tax=Euphorbia lathyris TaxID=212925 RepID=UPI0033131FCD